MATAARTDAAPDQNADRYVRAHALLTATWAELRPDAETTAEPVDAPDELGFADEAEPAEAAQREDDTGGTDETEVVEPDGGILGGLLVGGTIAAVLLVIGLVARWRQARQSGPAGNAVAEPAAS